MPKLSQAKDGHFFFRQLVFGHGTATWQVKPEGVAFLKKKGIHVDDDIPLPYVKRLRDSGQAYTGGSGLGVTPTKFTGNPDFEFEKVNFVLKEQGSKWKFGIFIPELGEDVVSAIVAQGVQSKCFLKVNELLIPMVQLWPGKGGAIVEVGPSLAPYQLRTTGPWPKQTSPKFPTSFQLSSCELFLISGDVARRIHRAAPLEPGATYLLVTRVPVGSGGAPEDFEDVTPELWRSKNWRWYTFSISESPSEELEVWCSRLGFAVQEHSWKLGLVSPPPVAYTQDGVPVIASRSVILMAKRPEGGKKVLDLELHRPFASEAIESGELKLQSSEMSGFVLFTKVSSPGAYIVRGTNTWVSPLAFRYDPDYQCAQTQPCPVVLKKGEVLVKGIGHTGQSTFTVSEPDGGFAIDSPVPLSVRVGTRLTQCETGEEASKILDAAWRDVYKTGTARDCTIDAGSFGAIKVLLSPVVRPAISSECEYDTPQFRTFAYRCLSSIGSRLALPIKPFSPQLVVSRISVLKPHDRFRAVCLMRKLRYEAE